MARNLFSNARWAVSSAWNLRAAPWYTSMRASFSYTWLAMFSFRKLSAWVWKDISMSLSAYFALSNVKVRRGSA